MGNSNTTKQTVNRSTSMNVLASLAAATGAEIGTGSARSAASRPKILRFVDGRPGLLSIGLGVSPCVADLGQLESKVGPVARLDELGEKYVRGCAALGLGFTGTIRTIEPNGTTGTVELRAYEK